MNKTTFKNSNGSLNAYAFSCGYVEKHKTKHFWFQMYMEHSIYHVRFGANGEGFSVWETFESNELTKARKFYKELIKKHK
jgi:hypothetical protein